MKTYLDFDLIIEPSGDGYVARVFNSPGGQASAEFVAPFSDLELENFLLRVGRTRHTVRRIESPEMATAKAFGGRLFNNVFAGDVRGCLRSSMDEASRQGAGLRVRLNLSKVPALADLPWEFLYNSGMNRFLSLSVETPLVRFLDLPERIRPVTVKPPLKVLMMISSPSDYPKLDVEREAAKISEALSSVEQQGLVTVERQDDATLSELQRRLRQGEYHIFHFVGHGGFDDQAQDGLLILEDQEERGRRVSAQFLGTLLHDHRPLRLAVLNACEGARASRSDPFAGTAQSLVQQGIPAVIAMQFEVTDEAAICFTREFYSAVATGYPVDAALSEARKAIFAEVSEIEWGTPVLYMRSPDGRIFDIEQVTEPDRKRMQVTTLLAAARTAGEAGDFATAVDKVNQALALDSTNADASQRLREITRLRETADAYMAGRTACDEGRWADAVKLLSGLDRAYRDVARLRDLAEQSQARAASEDARKRQSADLARDAMAAMTAERWDQAIEHWQALIAIEPEDRQGRGQLTEARRQKDLAERYARARGLYEGRHWREALQELQQIQHMAGVYKDVPHLLAGAERELHKPPPVRPEPRPHETLLSDVIKPKPPGKAETMRWMVVGGVVGISAIVGVLMLIGIIAVGLEDAAPTPPAPNPVVDNSSGIQPLVNNAGGGSPNVGGSIAPAPLSAAPAVLTPSIQQELREAILRADRNEILAFRTLNEAPLHQSYAGQKLQSHLSTLAQLKINDTFMVARLWRQAFGPMTLGVDGQTARVELVENWSSDFYSTLFPTVCAYHWHRQDIPQVIHLQRVNGQWLIFRSDQNAVPPAAADCHPENEIPLAGNRHPAGELLSSGTPRSVGTWSG
jgi:tetratricopeptide (TPR) repeat protein